MHQKMLFVEEAVMSLGKDHSIKTFASSKLVILCIGFVKEMAYF